MSLLEIRRFGNRWFLPGISLGLDPKRIFGLSLGGKVIILYSFFVTFCEESYGDIVYVI